MTRWPLLLLGVLAFVSPARASDPDAVERGRKALLTRSFSPPTITLDAYNHLWRQWGLDKKPAPEEYQRLFRERYGLHEAPYANNGFPMGVREAPLPFSLTKKGLSLDCMLCHAGSIGGQSYIGLGNTTLELQGFFEETSIADGLSGKTPFRFSNVRGTSEAGATAVYLLGFRNPDLTLRAKPVDLGLDDQLCEDVPAWWLLKKKKTMYYTGATDARSVRSIMQFMLSPLNTAEKFADEEKTFADIRAYILSLEPPKYPLPVDKKLAAAGEKLFLQNCARCHGTYGKDWTYPNKVIPIDEIGTDRRRFEGVSRRFGEHYNQGWFAQEKSGWFGDDYKVKETAGYQAPPLDGIWATAPYLHNGSAPTVYNVLNSKSRPKVFTRSFKTDLDAYDAEKLGWKVEVLDKAPDPATLKPVESRRIYDTSQPGRGNGGHTFGDHLSDPERMAVIEYLKTL
jgi:mono/diheme cytochrome c family protein